jgi:hypothetical protein
MGSNWLNSTLGKTKCKANIFFNIQYPTLNIQYPSEQPQGN